ncbi:porin [Thioalkalivibrio sp. ALJ24]|uniref:porin n=1 Tax=Thioalkalivibrio sp. ALJ24 TaxID=545276 RepID=UPI0003692F1C|nr:porin [Thioalkalivibrio sp. ALJ24]
MNRKHLLTSLITAGLVVPAVASADLTLYGRAHLSVDILDDGADYNELNVSSNSSRLGVSAKREFRDQIIGIAQIEQQIDFDTEGTQFATRDTFAGVRGDNWGMLRLGKFDTPFKGARGPANFFGDQVGDMRNLTRTTAHGRFDERFRNSIHYRSPDFGGVTWDFQYSNRLEGATTVDGADDRAYSTSLTLDLGGLNGALAYEKQEDGNDSPDAWRLAASYDVTDAITLGGLYQQSESFAGDDGEVFGFGGQFQVAPDWYLRGHIFHLDSDLDDMDATMYAFGGEYRVDSDLRFYANIASVDNDDMSSLTPWGAARTSGPGGAAGENALGVSLGMRYDF